MDRGKKGSAAGIVVAGVLAGVLLSFAVPVMAHHVDGGQSRRIKKLESRLSVMSAKVSALESKTSSNSGSISTLASRVSSLEGQVGTLNSRVSTLQSQAASLQVQVGTLQSQVGILQVQVGTLQNKTSKLTAFGDYTGDIGGDQVNPFGFFCQNQPAVWDFIERLTC